MTTESGRATRTRRRGAELERAIRLAALAELAETGYGALSMERVAIRAGTGKAALYRRWSSKRALVVDAVRNALPDPHDIQLPGNLRDDLIRLLTLMSDVLDGRTPYPGVDMIGDMFREPELREAILEGVIQPRLRLFGTALERAAARGELAAEAIRPLLARTGPALVIQSFLMDGRAPVRSEIAAIVDEVLLPLFTGGPAGGA